jgi:hypothetical protein
MEIKRSFNGTPVLHILDLDILLRKLLIDKVLDITFADYEFKVKEYYMYWKSRGFVCNSNIGDQIYEQFRYTMNFQSICFRSVIPGIPKQHYYFFPLLLLHNIKWVKVMKQIQKLILVNENQQDCTMYITEWELI